MGRYRLFRLGEIECVRAKDLLLTMDTDVGTTLTAHIKSSKTDRYDEGSFKTQKSAPDTICHVKMRSSLMTSMGYDADSSTEMFPDGLGYD